MKKIYKIVVLEMIDDVIRTYSRLTTTPVSTGGMDSYTTKVSYR